MYIGVNNIARKITSAYVGIDGKARKIKTVYVGDANGKARLVWQAIKNKLSFLKGTSQLSVLTDSTLTLNNTQCIYKDNNNHILLGVYADYYDGKDRCFLYNCHLNDDGSVSRYTRFETAYEQFDSRQVAINSICKLNDSCGACITSDYDNSGSSNFRYIHIFNLDNCQDASLANQEIQSGSLDYPMPIIQLNYDTVLFPCYSSSGYVYGYFYRYKDGKLTRIYYSSLTNGVEWLREPIMYGSCLAFPLSNNTSRRRVWSTSSST